MEKITRNQPFPPCEIKVVKTVGEPTTINNDFYTNFNDYVGNPVILPTNDNVQCKLDMQI